jgi:phosphodiesterase/alkaline phosphatase D-like protein
VVAENQFGVTYGKDMTFTTEPAPLPGITETSIEDITPTSAHVSAMVAPNRWDASWLFEWGETTAYGTFTETEPILPGENLEYQPIETDITHLEPGTIYHFRAVAFNFTGVTNGPDQVFRTPAAPKIDSAAVSAVGQTSAHLSSKVIANSAPTDVRFEYGPSTGYGSTSASFAIGSETLARESAADLTGLASGTTYHFRVVSVNKWGTTVGRDQTFTTLPGPQAPPPPPPAKTKCPKGKVKRHGKCVPKRKPSKKKNGKRHG